jgi:hypothetical protein
LVSIRAWAPVEDDGFLRQVFADRASTDRDRSRLRTGAVLAAVEFRRAGGRQQRACAGVEVETQIEPVAACHSARRMQQVDMAGPILLWMKRPLHDERAEMAAADETGLAGARREPQLQLGGPGTRLRRIARALQRTRLGGLRRRNGHDCVHGPLFSQGTSNQRRSSPERGPIP